VALSSDVASSGLETRTFISQPAPYGSRLTAAGSPSSAVLISTTSPEIGVKRSETAFTDSTTPTLPNCSIVVPIFGKLDVHDVAQRVLRVIGDADRRRIALHLHPLVLFAEKQFLRLRQRYVPFSLRAFVKRQRYHGCRMLRAAYLNLYPRVRLGGLRGDQRRRDIFVADRRSDGTATHGAGEFAIMPDGVSLAGRSTPSMMRPTTRE